MSSTYGYPYKLMLYTSNKIINKLNNEITNLVLYFFNFIFLTKY